MGGWELNTPNNYYAEKHTGCNKEVAALHSDHALAIYMFNCTEVFCVCIRNL